ncbi:hypothetical protein F751_0654 [Auxenochlorella protothecoides]|uniref:Uncharacterized protein n=1 Tax=Auxenochlorella protothecoides TaxID=3075 RepID=A0A087SQG4_AUXPR|nr:hypothetical protein F751_0654 [Auxenochlorella protothecoides]KFM27968.1 hypothetical protein F751_0654 [Auxenochlorella protothecoides]
MRWWRAWVTPGLIQTVSKETPGRPIPLYFPDLDSYAAWSSHTRRGAASQRLEHSKRYDADSGSWTVAVAAAPPLDLLVVHDGSREVGRYDLVQRGGGPVADRAGGVLLLLHAGAEAVPGSDGARPRRLAEAQDCFLAVRGTLYKFSGCRRARSYLHDFVVYTSLETGAGGRGVLRLGVQAAADGGWAGFGLSHTRSMEGGEVAVLATDERVPSGATISRFTLFSPLAERINAANGSFALPGAVAEAHPNGTLVGYFSVETPESAAFLASQPQYFLFARGPLAQPGVLGAHFHPTIEYPYGGIDMDLFPVEGVPASPLEPIHPDDYEVLDLDPPLAEAEEEIAVASFSDDP